MEYKLQKLKFSFWFMVLTHRRMNSLVLNNLLLRDLRLLLLFLLMSRV